MPFAWTRTDAWRCAGVLGLIAVVLALSWPARAEAAPRTCPFTFQVLHDDRIGPLRLPAGPYRITVLNSSRLSCASATDLFRQFLEDFDGRLPRPWTLTAATATFRRGRGSDVGFSVRRVGSPSGGGGMHPSTGRSCPAFFRVLHNDRIGRLRLRAGNYRITLVSVGRLSCARASRLFAAFLQDFDGRLPRPWFLDVQTGTFLRGSAHVGFRVKRASGNPVNPSGGGTHPSNGRRCRGTFRVLNNDRIGSLRLPRGPYIITLLRGRGLSCAGASRRFRSFLNDFEGDLPSPWVVRARTGTFTRGRRSRTGFRVKPVRLVRR
jgi:hypothetical protein